ncbi:MAG: glycosyltransferase family 2 protein, partial [Gammaproteobacteria bacterium]
SFSTDRTLEIAESLGAEVFQHEFVNQAQQFQWALDHCPIQTDWVMRMDADEYLEPDAQAEICSRLPLIEDDVDGLYLNRKVFFLGQWVRFGGMYPTVLLRIWRAGKGRMEQRWMDEHIVLPPSAKTVRFEGNIVDENLKGITAWVDKHNRYATREMVDLLNVKYGFCEKDDAVSNFDDPQARKKRMLKNRVYSRMPLGLRALFYFLYRYVFRLGFLDGSRGFVFHFMQGFWYRLLVDVKIMEVETRCQGDVQRLRQLLESDYGIQL